LNVLKYLKAFRLFKLSLSSCI